MLCLKHISIKFPSKTVFNDSSFHAHHGLLTVIQGRSGIGKSTLIDTLLFKHSCEYIYNDKDISKLDDEQKSNFLFRKVGIVYQVPSFMEYLTVQEHISFVQDLYGLHKDKSELIKRLNIELLMDKFPKQLSGGEKTRVALYLSLLKKPEILILDEPTASLDADNKKIVIEVLRNYAHKRNGIVIVTTHDHEVIDGADTLYEIIDQDIKEVKKDSKHESEFISIEYKKDINKLDRYINKIRRHYKLINKIMMGVLSLTIAFLVLSYSINNASIAQMNAALNNMASREIIVFKPLFEENHFSFYSQEFPMTDEEVQMIKDTEHVEKVEWRFDLSLDGYYLMLGDSEVSKKYDEIGANVVTGYDGNNKEKTYVEELSDIKIHTYIDEYDYSESISKIWGNDGIYITPDLYYILFKDGDIKHPYLEFCMMIPMYDSQFRYLDSSENSRYTGNHVTCNYKIVKLPIRGVTSEDYLTHEEAMGNQIFIPKSYLESLIKQQDIPDKRVVYWSNTTQKEYYDVKPEGITIDQTCYQTKWRPSGYSVFIDDVSSLDTVVKELTKKGFKVESQYINTENILNTKESIKNTMMMVSGGMTVLVGALYFFMKYVHRNSYFENDRFLESIGLNKKEVQSLKHSEWVKNARDMFIIGSIGFFIMRMILHSTKEVFIRLEPKIFVMILVFTLISEFVFPYILTRVMKHD